MPFVSLLLLLHSFGFCLSSCFKIYRCFTLSTQCLDASSSISSKVYWGSPISMPCFWELIACCVIHELLMKAESCASSSAADVLQLLVGTQPAAPGWSYCQEKHKIWASRQHHSTGGFSLQTKANVDTAINFSPTQGHTFSKTMCPLLNVSDTVPLICKLLVHLTGLCVQSQPWHLGGTHWAWCSCPSHLSIFMLAE